MRKILLVLLILFTAALTKAQAQNGSLYGVVKDSSGGVLEGVTLKIKGSYFGAVTDPDGKYNIENIPDGSYTLQVSYSVLKRLNIQRDD